MKRVRNDSRRIIDCLKNETRLKRYANVLINCHRCVLRRKRFRLETCSRVTMKREYRLMIKNIREKNTMPGNRVGLRFLDPGL